MKKNLIILLINISTATLNCFAHEPEIKLRGGIDFQSAVHNHNLSKSKYISSYNKHVAFSSLAHVNLEIFDNINATTVYGAKISIETTTTNDRRIPSSLYLISSLGKFEIGSDKSATNKMKITGYSVSAGTFGSWDSWTRLIRYPDKIVYILNFGNFLDGKTREGNRVEFSRKISYFTPKISGIQFGISYIPDTSNTGYSQISDPVRHSLARPSKQLFAIKNAVGYGLSFERKMNDSLGVKTAIVGENGTVSLSKCCKHSLKNTQKYTNIRTYTIGSEINYNQYAIAASYSNYMRSLTLQSDPVRSTYLYSLGGRYKFLNFTTSLNHFFSKHKNNKFHATTFAVDYKIASGMLSYVEIVNYNTNGKFIENNKPVNDKTRGVLVLTGIKLEF